MKQQLLGRLWPVSTLTLGGGGLGMLWGPTTFDECVATVHDAVAAGIILLDLAPRYGDGKAEEVVGEAFAGRLESSGRDLEAFGWLRSDVHADCSLARAVKRTGGSIWMGLTRNSRSLRGYDTCSEIRDLIARTAFTQLRYSSLLLLGTILGMVLSYLVPAALAFTPQPLVWRLSLTAWALMTVTYLPTVRYYELPPLWTPLLPLAAAFYSYATCVSAVRYWLGQGGQWKGRAQAPAKL